jgi:ParB family chromosome partitioning protein
MSAKKRGLGRGLDALLGVRAGPETAPPGAPTSLPIERLQPGRYQPRHGMDEEALHGLADSIKAQGIIQPIVVRALASGAGYEIIAGERRWRAARLAGLAEVPVILRAVADESALSLALIENIQRENLNPLDEAQALARLTNEFNMTHQQVADAIGRSRAAVSNLLRLLELGADVRALLAEGKLEMGHARALLALAGVAQTRAANTIVVNGLSVRAAEALVRRVLESGARKRAGRKAEPRNPDVARLEQDLSERLGARVAVDYAASGKGRVTIHYNSLDELDGILDHIR